MRQNQTKTSTAPTIGIDVSLFQAKMEQKEEGRSNRKQRKDPIRGREKSDARACQILPSWEDIKLKFVFKEQYGNVAFAYGEAHALEKEGLY